ncbi:MAG: DUF58 domain-containing protein [Candidatus Heimdallarchaeota archaeon]
MSEINLLNNRIEGLSILARQKVSSFLSGNRRSLFLGHGTEFADLREYVYGDDQRHVDWRATAKRLNKLIVRDYEVERNTNVIFILDSSASMLLGDTQSRIKSAVIAVASLTHASIANKDFFGFGYFSDDQEVFIPPKSGKPQEYLIYKKLLNLIPKGKTNLGMSLSKISSSLKQRSLFIVLTDLHDDLDELFKGLRISKGFNHEVKVMQFSNRNEFVLPENLGKVKFIHQITKKIVQVNLSDPISSGLYSFEIEKDKNKLKDFKRKLRGIDVDVIECFTENVIEQVLLTYFSTKRKGI